MIKQNGVIAFALKCFTALIIVVAAGTTVRWAESEFWPVVPEFVVDEERWDGKTLTVWGVMNKDRACKFEQLMAYYKTPHGLPNIAPVDYPKKKSRPPIEQRFGPIWITLPDDYTPGTSITFWVTHRCHSLWTSVSPLATFTPTSVEKAPPVL